MAATDGNKQSLGQSLSPSLSLSQSQSQSLSLRRSCADMDYKQTETMTDMDNKQTDNAKPQVARN